MSKKEYDRRIDLIVSLPYDEAIEFPRRAKPGEKYEFHIEVIDGKKPFAGRVTAKVYHYDPRKVLSGAKEYNDDFVGYCEFTNDTVGFFVPSELRGMVTVDFELFDVNGTEINSDCIYCETNKMMLTPVRIEIENPVSVMKEEEKTRDVAELEAVRTSEANNTTPPTEPSRVSSLETTKRHRRSRPYAVSIFLMLLVIGSGILLLYIVNALFGDWVHSFTNVSVGNSNGSATEEELVGFLETSVDVPDAEYSEEEIVESVVTVISPPPDGDLEVVCPKLDDEMREKTETYVHAISALNAEVDLAGSQRDDALRKHEACERELEIAAMASQPVDVPVIIVDPKKEDIIPLHFPIRKIKPKGEPLVLEDLEGIPTFDTMTISEKRIFLRLHNKTFKK